MGTGVLLDLLGGVALLLWGLHMVSSGVQRAFGAELRHVLGRALSNRFAAFLAGAGITALLQSSTATAMMTASFAGRGLVRLAPALAIMLGANVGTALVVQLLSFNVSALTPFLLFAGLLAFKNGRSTRVHDLGRVAIGLGLMLLSLHILLDTLAPAEQAPAIKALLPVITSQPLLCVVIAAALAWAAHSSMAVVLLTMSLAYADFIDPTAALALVLGANLGTAINPLIEGADRSNPASLRMPVGNLANRLLGVAIMFPLLRPAAAILADLVPNAARMTADFHLAFNLGLAALFILPLNLLARLLTWALPENPKPADPATPLYLDESSMATPSLALACAARETLRVGDIVETMLRQAITALMTNDRKLGSQISKTDDVVDQLVEATKLYVTRLTRESLEDRDGRRAMEIVAFAINLEHVGDIIDKNLMDLAGKKIRQRLQFSKEGAAELTAFHKRVVDNMQLAFGVFLSGDVTIARKLLDEKTQLRAMELTAADSHLARLREGRPESIESSALHLDVLRDLKRIHSHICSVAYPVLEAAGALQPSRLRDPDAPMEAAPAARERAIAGPTGEADPAQA